MTLSPKQARLRAAAINEIGRSEEACVGVYWAVTDNHPGRALQRLRRARKYLDEAEVYLSEWQALRSGGEEQGADSE